jgi:inhibitor of KinA
VSDGVQVIAAGDSALFVEFEERIDPLINARAIALADSIHAARLAGVRDIVPTYRSVAVYFDPLATDRDALVAYLERAAGRPAQPSADDRQPIRVPVCYGEDFGPDLAVVAAFGKLDPADVIRLHTGTRYRVYMLGFLPGFAYMGIVDHRISAPRRATPRVRVSVGSVGIAGSQTGIYPAETPGGWQLIGRTPIRPFDVSRPTPFLLQAGDAVEFYPIDRGEYDRLSPSH